MLNNAGDSRRSRATTRTWRDWIVKWVMLAAITLCASAASEVQPFTSKRFPEIREAHAGQPFVVAFWSTHCEPCKAEIALLTRFHREFPSVKIILVATDTPAERSSVEHFLAKYELGQMAVYQFGDEAEERIRFSVDPHWRGELPRSYFFDRRGEVTAQSGVPDEIWVRRWFERATHASLR